MGLFGLRGGLDGVGALVLGARETELDTGFGRKKDLRTEPNFPLIPRVTRRRLFTRLDALSLCTILSVPSLLSHPPSTSRPNASCPATRHRECIFMPPFGGSTHGSMTCHSLFHLIHEAVFETIGRTQPPIFPFPASLYLGLVEVGARGEDI